MSTQTAKTRPLYSWADDEGDNWDYDTWKKQVEDDTPSANAATNKPAVSPNTSRWADEEDNWDYEEWKRQAEEVRLTTEELGPLQQQAEEEDVYETFYSETMRTSQASSPTDEYSNDSSEEEGHTAQTTSGYEPPLVEDYSGDFDFENQNIVVEQGKDNASYEPYCEPVAAIWGERVPKMHWYRMAECDGDNKPQYWRYEYTKNWQERRQSSLNTHKAHEHSPLDSSPLALHVCSVDEDDEQEDVLAIDEIRERDSAALDEDEQNTSSVAYEEDVDDIIAQIIASEHSGEQEQTDNDDPRDSDDSTALYSGSSSGPTSSPPSSHSEETYDETEAPVAPSIPRPQAPLWDTLSYNAEFPPLPPARATEIKAKSGFIPAQAVLSAPSTAIKAAEGPNLSLLCPASDSTPPRKESAKTTASAWSDYTSVGIAAIATVAVAGGLFFAFIRRRN